MVESIERWRDLGNDLYAIQNDRLLMTEVGLMYAMRLLPYEYQKRYGSFRWAGEFFENDKRWLKIQCYLRIDCYAE